MSLDNMNLDLLDATLEDLADLKKFEPLPVGSYRMGIKWSFPADDQVVIVQLDLAVLECLEVPGVEEDKLPEVGKKASFYMRLQNKDGSPILWPSGEVNDQDQGRLKEILLALAPVFNPDGTLSNKGMIEASEGAEVLVALKIRVNKRDPDMKFNQIKSIVLAD
jgi:hypothetical protein